MLEVIESTCLRKKVQPGVPTASTGTEGQRWCLNRYSLFQYEINNPSHILILTLCRCNIEYGGKVFVLTYSIIPNGLPSNSPFEAGAYE